MKFNKLVFVSILLLFFISLCAVNAQDNSTSEIIEEQNSEDLDPVFEVTGEIKDDIKTVIEDNVTVYAEDSLGDITSDDVVVDVNNVFEGQNATIFVTVPEATGTVNVTVGGKLYTSEFISGVATQSISEYSIGLNNVTVKYNDIVKETSFKALDGVVTNETVKDYLEISGYDYELASCIPEGSTLDFRGNIFIEVIPSKAQDLRINRSINMVSSTKDAVIDFGGDISIINTAIASIVSNIKFNKLSIRSSSSVNVVNSTINDFYFNINTQNSSMISNCFINKFSGGSRHNLLIYNSTFRCDLLFASSIAYKPFNNLTLKNCFIEGNVEFRYAANCSIENNTITEGNLVINAVDSIVKNNRITSMFTTYAIIIDYTSTIYRDNIIVDNVLYSKKYCGDSAVYDNKINPHIIKNNTPNQVNLNVGCTLDNFFYDGNTTVIVNMPNIEGNVTFFLNNEKISVVQLVDGIATQVIDKYCTGINNITVIYEDVINDIWGINHTSFNVEKVDCPIYLVYDCAIENNPSFVKIFLPEDAYGIVTLTLKYGIYLINIEHLVNGTNNIINIPSLLGGNYTMVANFSSSNIKYLNNFTMGNINVVHIPVYKLSASNVVMDYKDGSKYKILVTKDGKAVSGDVVKITFNGKTKSVKTDKNGYATFMLDAAPKTYTIKAVYNGVTKSSKVTIKSVLKAKNISKKKSKTIKFSATLKTSKGKAITGKKIIFKLKSKTYSAKTNKKGIATISIKNLKVGKYTINSKYGACTVKNTIKVKK